ncbi:MAG: type IV secretory system conjugative DNA transfer family protein, partial [Oscillospiraceae bacterium]
LLKKALVAAYSKCFITWDTEIGTLKPEDFPTMSDLYAVLQTMQKDDSRYEVLAALLCDMATGADSFLWNGHTNIEVDSNFVCFDTNRIQNSSEEVKRTQYFNLLTLCWQLMSADRTKPVFLLCDEAHLLLDPAIPQTAMFMRNMSKRGRKYEAMLGVVMQSVTDALNDKIRLYGQALMDNASYKLFFGTDGKNLQETAALFNLTEAEQQILLSKQRGHALCFFGNQHLYVDFDIPQYKLELMGSGGGR